MNEDQNSQDESVPGGEVPRLTPYELVFLEGEFESHLFPRVRSEAAEQGVEASDPERFDFLSTTADIVRAVTPEDAPPEALEQYRALLFHAFHFWAADRRVFSFDLASSRFLVEAAPSLADWEYAVPAAAGYVQFPPNLYWTSIAPEAAPEPIDGFFFADTSITGPDETIERRLHLLFILGIYRSRAGFSVIPLETGIEPDLFEVLASEPRPGGDFSNTLPGGEISGLYSILTTTEAFKLAARTFWYIDRFPESLEDEETASLRASDADPPPSQLAYTRVTLRSPSDETDVE